MGEILGVGATMAELRRSQVCHISESDSLLKIHDLVDAVYLWKNDDNESKLRKLIQPVESALSDLKKLVIRDSAIDSICHGAQLAIPGILQLSNNILKNDPIAVYSLKGELVSIGKAELSSQEITDLDKGIAVLTDRVIMNVGTYPKMWKSSDIKNNT
jgi:H/ACA ribonucleoprotein complex subunit 4